MTTPVIATDYTRDPSRCWECVECQTQRESPSIDLATAECRCGVGAGSWMVSKKRREVRFGLLVLALVAAVVVAVAVISARWS